MTAYVQLLIHLMEELHIWRYVRAGEEVGQHVTRSLQSIYIVVQQVWAHGWGQTWSPGAGASVSGLRAGVNGFRAGVIVP